MATASYQPPISPGETFNDEENPLVQEECVQLNENDNNNPPYGNFSDGSHINDNNSRTTPYQMPVDPNSPPPDLPIGQKRALFIWLILATVIDGFLFLMSMLMCLMSVMFFDAGVTIYALIAVGIVLCIPVLIVGAIVASWKAYNAGNYRLVILLNLFPSLIVITYILGLAASQA